MQCSLVQCSAVQSRAVQYSAVNCSVVQCSEVQCSAVPCRAVWLFPLSPLIMVSGKMPVQHKQGWVLVIACNGQCGVCNASLKAKKKMIKHMSKAALLRHIPKVKQEHCRARNQLIKYTNLCYLQSSTFFLHQYITSSNFKKIPKKDLRKILTMKKKFIKMAIHNKTMWIMCI